MRAVVLVGGEGTRLRPLTHTRPKPILQVGQASMLEGKLAHLAAHGVTEAVLSLGYKPDVFLSQFPTNEASGVRLHYAVEPSPLDTAGAIRFAADAAGFSNDDIVIAVNGDVLTDIDLGAQLAFHVASDALATIALTQVDDPSRFGVVPIDDDGRVVAFVEKPKREEAPTDWINAGIYVLSNDALHRIPVGERVSIERVVFPALAAQGRLYAVEDPAYWLDAGTPATLIQANVDWVRRGGVARHESASVAAGTTDELTVVNAAAVIEAGATVRGSVVMAGARICVGASVVDSIVGEGAVVESGAKLSGLTIVGDRSIVPAGDHHDARF